MLIWPEASSAQNSMAAVSADGSTVCVLILRLNSSCSRSIAFVVRTREGEEPVAGFLKTIGNSPVLKPPLADEGFAARFDLFACVRVDHIFVVGADLVMQALGGVTVTQTRAFAQLPRESKLDDGTDVQCDAA
jgi:hypothetical protein